MEPWKLNMQLLSPNPVIKPRCQAFRTLNYLLSFYLFFFYFFPSPLAQVLLWEMCLWVEQSGSGEGTLQGAQRHWWLLVVQESMPRDYINGARTLPALLKVNPSLGQCSCLIGEQRSSCRGRGMETRFSGLIYLRRLVFRMGRTQFKWCSLGMWWQSL